jgi:hypothetical protein
MNMARVTHLVCDKCGQQEGVASFTITTPGGKARMDLCPKHAKPLTDLVGDNVSSGRTARRIHDLDADGNPIL